MGQKDLINAYKYLVGGNKEEAARLITVLPTERTRGNGHKLKKHEIPSAVMHPACAGGLDLMI